MEWAPWILVPYRTKLDEAIFSQIGDKRLITLCLVGKEVINFASGTVVCDDVKALVIHVKDQVLTLIIFQHDEEIASNRRPP